MQSFIRLSALSMGLAASVPALAQGPAADGASAPAVDDIIVTANRREQSLQDVGISIAALTGAELRRLNVNTALDIANTTPNIEVIRSYAAPGFNTQITIRGVGQPDFQDTTEATATAYVDEFYMIGAGQADFLSFDIARAEIARGPQGTVQGRNSTAGSLNFYTSSPDPAASSGRISATLARFGTIRSEGYVNLALADQLAIRLSFAGDSSGGYVRNINPSGFWSKGGKSRFWAGRAQLLYRPSETVQLTLKAELGQMGPVSAGNEKMYPVGTRPGQPGTFPVEQDGFGQSPQSTGAADIDVVNADGVNEISSKLEHYLARLDITPDDNWNFVVLGGWLRSEKYSLEDCDHTPLSICNFSNDATSRHWMIEARASYDRGPARVTMGTSYLKHRIETLSGTPLFFEPATNPFGTSLYGQAFDDTQRLSSFAVFGQAEYDLSERLTLIAGLRYTYDDKQIDAINAVTTSLPLDTPPPRTREAFAAFAARVFADPGASFTLLNPSLNGSLATFKKGLVNANVQLNFRPSEDVLLYASYRRGVKSGGFISGNVAGTPAELRPFGEETNNAYEIGAKSSFADGRVRLNGAVFYYDYRDMQNTSLIGITNVITNNDAKVYGFEAELTATPTEGLTAFVGAGYVHTEVEGINNPTGAVPIVSDNRLPLAPRFSANARLRYDWGLGDGGLYVQGAARYRTSMFRDSLNNPSTNIPSLFVADVRVGYTAPENRWSLSGFVDNLFDTRRPINLCDLAGLANSGEKVHQMPRTFGATLGISF